MRTRRILSQSFNPKLAASMWQTYLLITVTSDSPGILGTTSRMNFCFLRLFFFGLFESVGLFFIDHLKLRGNLVLNCMIFNLVHSSRTGAAIQLVTKSAENKVIRFGRYFNSRNDQGSTSIGTFGVNSNIGDSHMANAPSRMNVVTITSRTKVKRYPNVAVV